MSVLKTTNNNNNNNNNNICNNKRTHKRKNLLEKTYDMFKIAEAIYLSGKAMSDESDER